MDTPHTPSFYNEKAWKVIAVVMCGGRGARMGGREKPLVKVLGKPLISYTLGAIQGCSAIKSVDFVTSIHTPQTTKYLQEMGYEPYIAQGAGFLNDLSEYLTPRQKATYLIVSCDIPTLKPHHIQTALDISQQHEVKYIVYVLPYDSVKGLSRVPTIIRHGGVEYQPAGLRIFRKDSEGPPDFSTPNLISLEFRELGININTLEDIHIAEDFLKKDG
jgi:GTP:adenosylcobinamide-phosphate guanylyltransferase